MFWNRKRLYWYIVFSYTNRFRNKKVYQDIGFFEKIYVDVTIVFLYNTVIDTSFIRTHVNIYMHYDTKTFS